MESPARTMVKGLTWQMTGIVTMTLIAWLITGSVTEGGITALSGAATGFVFYFFHERIWARIGWGRGKAG